MSAETPGKSITLYFREGSSDKVYQAAIEPRGDGFVVNFAFGRRGSTFQTGTKTTAPVDYEAALKTYDKLVKSKMAKGYTPGEDGTPYQGTDRQTEATGILPQLLNAIDEEQAQRLIDDPEWCAQEKFDGKRILIRKTGDEVVGINRKGLVVALPREIVDQALSMDSRQWIMDGESIGDAYVAFDLLEQDGVSLRPEPYSRRLAALTTVVALGEKGSIRVACTACDAVSKSALLSHLRQNHREGIVFKLKDAPYSAGRPASGGSQLKLKFTATASCIVARANGTKRSVALALLDGGARVAVGNVTIPANQPIPKAGSVVEIRYLYAYPGGSLFQPVCLGLRDDIDPAACTLGQLKHKAAAEDDEAESDTEGRP